MRKIVFGGIYIIAGLLAIFVLHNYGIGFGRHDLDILLCVPIISIISGIIFSIKGLGEGSEDNK